MKKFAKKFSFIVLAATLAAGTFTGCSQAASGTVVVGSLEMNGIFSPFFYTTGYDGDIASLVHAGLVKSDRQAQPVGDLADFTIKEEGGQSIYTFTLKDGVEFSDGTAITADDVIFNYLVYLDPTYDGMSTLSSVPIVGVEEYKNGDATEVSGIQKVDDKTVTVTIDGVDPAAIWKLGISICPKSYYGVDYAKGSLAGIKTVNGTPMGAGPYKYESFENNVVTLTANENYFDGAPQIAKLKFQVVDEASKLESVKSGDLDISDPSASPEMVAMVQEAGYHYELIDNLGYGYIGMNADRIPDVNVRKGLMHLMNRKPAVETYYGDLATVIERPLTTVSWAYPEGATEYYGYDTDKALEYFTTAGYVKDASGKLMKDGKQLRVEVGIPGGGVMDHPTAPVLTQMKTDMEAMGAVLEIADTEGSVFFDRLNAEEWDMWVAAWGATPDPDMYQIYHTDGATNRYNIYDDRLDEVIELARQTNDIAARKEYYTEALDIIMDEAVEMPVYQRKNLVVFNQENIDITSLPENMTPYYTYMAEIQGLKTLDK